MGMGGGGWVVGMCGGREGGGVGERGDWVGVESELVCVVVSFLGVSTFETLAFTMGFSI